MKITIIGGGHIGGATAIGLSKAGAAEVTVTGRRTEALEKFNGTGINTSLSNRDAVKGADIIVIAVKTANVRDVVEEIRNELTSEQIVACMAAQVTPSQMQEWLRKDDGRSPKLAYVIPNTAIELLESMTFISDVSAGDAGIAMLMDVFAKAGECLSVDIRLLPAGIALASCGTGYAMKYICAAIEGGMAVGLSEEDATKAVCQTVRGATGLLKAHGQRPEDEVRKVATPGGLTERGVNAMERAGFTAAVIEGLKASL